MPLLLTTRSILDEIGMDENEVVTFDGFCEATTRFKSLYPDGDLLIDLTGSIPLTRTIRLLTDHFGFRYIDFERGELTVDRERFRQFMDIVKLYYDPDYDAEDRSKLELDHYLSGGALHFKTCLFDTSAPSNFGKY